LGLGFILIEIVLLQRFQLFLGEPIYTFSIVLSSLLIFTGVGSYLAGRVEDLSRDRLTWFLLVLVGTILLTLAVMPGILSLALGLALPLRVAIAISLVAPLGMLLGVPFPTGLRIVGEQASPLVPWAWAVNGFFTVIGSVAAMILGMVVGFTYVLVIAAGCYATALIAIRGVQPHGVALAEVHTGKPHAERLARLRAPDTVG
jgi:MFS family permease